VWERLDALNLDLPIKLGKEGETGTKGEREEMGPAHIRDLKN